MAPSTLLFPDRMSGHYTVWLLVLLAAALAVYQQLVDHPITCNTPAHFTDQVIRYAHEACWNADTYFIPRDIDELVQEHAQRDVNHKLHQRLPAVLLGLALLMVVPVCVWLVLQRHPGLPLQSLLSTGRHCMEARDSATYQRLCSILGNRLGGHLLDIRKNRGAAQLLTVCNTYLTLSYALCRLLQVVVSCVCLMQVRHLMGSMDVMDVLHLTNGTSDNSTDYFPRIILCDYTVQSASRLHAYIHQCQLDHTLPLTVLALVVAWLSLLATINITSLLQFVLSSAMVPCTGGGGVHASLRATGLENIDPKFAAAVGRDGALMMQLVGQACSEGVAAEMMAGAHCTFTQSCSMETPATIPLQCKQHDPTAPQAQPMYPNI